MNVLDFLDPTIRDPHSGGVIGHDEDIAKAREALLGLIRAARKAVEYGCDDGSREELHAAVARVGGAE